MKEVNPKQIKKIVVKPAGVKISWEHHLDCFHLESSERPKKELEEGLQAFQFTVLRALDLPLTYSITITGVTIIGEAENEGIIFTGFKKLEDGRVFNINTPILKDELNNNDLVSLQYLKTEAALFVKGDRSQLNMFQEANQ